jgi:hypothetical protein
MDEFKLQPGHMDLISDRCRAAKLPPWVRQEHRSDYIEPYWSDMSRQLAKGHIVGMLLLKCPGARSNLLSLTTEEHRLMHDLYHVKNQFQLVSFEIVEAVCMSNFAGRGVDSDMPLLAPVGDRRAWQLAASNFTKEILPIGPEYAGCLRDVQCSRHVWPDGSGGANLGSVAEVLARWGYKHDNVVELVSYVVQVAQPLCTLILYRQWSVFMTLLPSDMGSLSAERDCPDSADIDEDEENDDDTLLTADRLRVLSNAVRRWAPKVLDTRPGQELWFSEGFVMSMVRWADRLEKDLVSKQHIAHDARGRHGFCYQSALLVQ